MKQYLYRNKTPLLLSVLALALVLTVESRTTEGFFGTLALSYGLMVAAFCKWRND